MMLSHYHNQPVRPGPSTVSGSNTVSYISHTAGDISTATNSTSSSSSSSSASSAASSSSSNTMYHSSGGYIESHAELEQLAATMPPVGVSLPDHLASSRSHSRMSISHTKGLLNAPGQNNCFLNSAVQVLWHLDIFRRNFRQVHGHACLANDSCIFCALKELFNQFQYSKESALPPDSLRLALAETFSDQRRFQLGFMDDAAECFENILTRIHYHMTNKEVGDGRQCAPHCIPHQKFAMNLYEQLQCHACGSSSEPFAFTQMIHYVSTAALCAQNTAVNDRRISFGSRLKIANSLGDIRNCPKMCGAKSHLRKILLNKPDVLSLCLVWDSEQPSPNLIRSLFNILEPEIEISETFDVHSNVKQCLTKEQSRLQLAGLVTYYGKHYSTYLFHSNLRQWIYFDDATVRVIGSQWSQVVDKCVKGHFQPLLLLYANAYATTIDTRYAFTQNVPMTVFNNTNNANNNGVSVAAAAKINSNNSSNNNNKTVNINNNNVANKAPVNNVIPPKASATPSMHTHPSPLTPPTTMSTLAKHHVHLYHHDIPDSPSATSTTSYFSEQETVDSGYISRRTVEKILMKQSEAGQNRSRNSTSSMDSFEAVRSTNKPVAKSLVCSLQRRDSGNSSGERASSVSSVETPIYALKKPIKKAPSLKSSKSSSDQGYDSFSLSSTDSYPCTASSPSKNTKLCEIPEADQQLIEMLKLVELEECDRLGSEVDVLLLKSHEKEQEGDLRAAAALSDSATARARDSLNAPYSNHQSMISSKMKHSMCVLRSANLHKRVAEMESEGKRIMKDFNHSRQNSRDSLGGRHSRQNSRDAKDPKCKSSENLELYATLPKKSSRVSKSPSHADSVPVNVQNKKESDFSDYYSEWEGLKKKKSGAKNKENLSEVYGEIDSTGSLPKDSKKQCRVKRKLLLGGLLKSKNQSLPDLRDECLKQTKNNPTPETAIAEERSVANVSTRGFYQFHRKFAAEQGAALQRELSSRLVKVLPPSLVTATPTPPSAQSDKASFKTPLIASKSGNNAPIVSIDSTTMAMPQTTPQQSQMQSLSQTQSNTVGRSVTVNPFLDELNQKRNQILKSREIIDNESNHARLVQLPSPSPSTASSSHQSSQHIQVGMSKPSALGIANFIKTQNTNNNNNNNNNNTTGSKHVTVSDRMRLPDIHIQIQVPIPVHANRTTRLAPPDYESTLQRLAKPLNSVTPSASTQSTSQAPVVAVQPVSAPNPFPVPPKANKPKSEKKSVKFSDTIEWVACAGEDYEEEYIPNPLLEKVLSNKSIVYTLQK